MNQPKLKRIVETVNRLPLDDKRELLRDSLKQLNGHPGFDAFLAAIYEMRQAAVAAAVAQDSVGNIGRTRAALGEIRAYEDIFAVVEEYITETS